MNMNRNDMMDKTATDKAQEVTEQAGKKVSETAAAAKEQAKRTVAQVGEQAKTNVDSRMGEVAQELSGVAEAVRMTSHELGSQDQPGIARYGNRIADQIEQASTYLSGRGVEEILADAEGLARRQPALFLGGAFTLGLLVGRFMRSSGHQLNDSYRGYDTGQYGDPYGGSGSATYQGSGRSMSYSRTGMGSQSGGTGTSGQSGRASYEMGAATGANESSYRQGPSVYNTSNQEEFGDNPTAYPTGLAESDE